VRAASAEPILPGNGGDLINPLPAKNANGFVIKITREEVVQARQGLCGGGRNHSAKSMMSARCIGTGVPARLR
jgi:hypothetical protein